MKIFLLFVSYLESPPVYCLSLKIGHTALILTPTPVKVCAIFENVFFCRFCSYYRTSLSLRLTKSTLSRPQMKQMVETEHTNKLPNLGQLKLMNLNFFDAPFHWNPLSLKCQQLSIGPPFNITSTPDRKRSMYSKVFSNLLLFAF